MNIIAIILFNLFYSTCFSNEPKSISHEIGDEYTMTDEELQDFLNVDDEEVPDYEGSEYD